MPHSRVLPWNALVKPLCMLLAGLSLIALLVFVPPARAAGKFRDDDGNVHEKDIDDLASRGITEGCNPPANDRYCPASSVTRGQMAAFLRRSLDLPGADEDRFVDDDGSVFERDIQALAAAGVTRGCNPPANDRYCPNGLVTREEMAAFLVRGFALAGNPNDAFADDDRSIFEGDINRLASAGVTLGCNPPDNDRYCPRDDVRRDEIASFLVRALTEAGVRRPDTGPPGRVEPGFSFTAGGDIGADSDTDATLAAMASRKGDFFLALGDLSYSDVVPESAWCDYMKGHLGDSFPIQLVGGNHEDDHGDDGFIGNFLACLPDRMHSVGAYGAEYYFDVGNRARIIMIAADSPIDGVSHAYTEGSERMAWLDSAIRGASDDQWVIVGMHKNCITAGIKGCETGADLVDHLIEGGVDLVLQGHDHTYQRSKQLRCAEVGAFEESCVTDDGSDGVYPAHEGTVFVITGLMGGGSPYDIDPDDPEYRYFAETLGAGDPDVGYGFSRIEVDGDSIDVEFVGTTSDYTDAFTIR